MQRRALLAATLAAPALPAALSAQETWPSRSVSVLLGYPPGGVTDFGARGVVDRMSRELGQTLVVDNRPGAATAVANNAAAQAAVFAVKPGFAATTKRPPQRLGELLT